MSGVAIWAVIGPFVALIGDRRRARGTPQALTGTSVDRVGGCARTGAVWRDPATRGLRVSAGPAPRTSTRAIPMAATNGPRPRPSTATTARTDAAGQTDPRRGRHGATRAQRRHHRTHEQHPRREHPHPAGPQPLRQSADPGGGVVREVRAAR